MKELFIEMIDLVEAIVESVRWNYRKKHGIKDPIQIEWEDFNEHTNAPLPKESVKFLVERNGNPYID